MANEKIHFKRKIKWNILFFFCFEYLYEQILNAIGLFKKMKKEKKSSGESCSSHKKNLVK